MFSFLKKYYHCLHGQWPAGKVEKLPLVGEDGKTNVAGVRIVGDLSGVPLLKFSSETGTRAVRAILAEPDFSSAQEKKSADVVDIAIIGAGVSGVSAAMEAKKAGLSYQIFEATGMFNTVANFPKAKPIFTYPNDMTPSGGVQYGEKSAIKEGLLEDMQRQVEEHDIKFTTAHVERVQKKSDGIHIHLAPKKRAERGEVVKALRCVIGIGRSGNFRKLGVPGEELDKVSNRLHDPKDYAGKKVAVVGGGDSAMEAAIALEENGAEVSVIYRGKELNRPKPENAEKIHALANEKNNKNLSLLLNHNPSQITETALTIKEGKNGGEKTIANDFVFSLIGREAPLEFFRRSGINISGDRGKKWWVTLLLFLFFCIWMYHWKTEKLPEWASFSNLNPAQLTIPAEASTKGFENEILRPSSLMGTLRISASSRSFYYTLAYCLCVGIFGIRRIRRRKTPYIKLQTLSLIAIQFLPLFLLPEVILPWAGHNGAFGKEQKTFILSHTHVEDWKKHEVKDAKHPDDPSKIDAWETLEVLEDKVRQRWQNFGDMAPEIRGRREWPGVVFDLLDSHENKIGKATIDFNNAVFNVRELPPHQRKNQNQSSKIDSQKPLLHSIADSLFPQIDYGHGREYWRAYGFILAWPLFIYNCFTSAPLWGWLIISLIQTFIIIPLIVRRWGKGAYCGWICSCGALAETMGDTHRHKMPHGAGATRLNITGQIFLAFAFLLLIFRIIGWAVPGTDFVDKTFLYLSEKLPFFNYKYFVDLIWAGIIGVSFYFHFSGRVWCRFACPLAALMHIYHRLFGRYRIFAEKKKCISCNVCTSVCHQGIDIMSVANKGHAMNDPQCVRCSACVQQCPTGVLTFGRLDKNDQPVFDRIKSSPLQ